MDRGRGGEADGLADLPDGGRVTAFAQVRLDHLEDLALAVGEGGHRPWAQAYRCSPSTVKHPFRKHLFALALDSERTFVARCLPRRRTSVRRRSSEPALEPALGPAHDREHVPKEAHVMSSELALPLEQLRPGGSIGTCAPRPRRYVRRRRRVRLLLAAVLGAAGLACGASRVVAAFGGVPASVPERRPAAGHLSRATGRHPLVDRPRPPAIGRRTARRAGAGQGQRWRGARRSVRSWCCHECGAARRRAHLARRRLARRSAIVCRSITARARHRAPARRSSRDERLMVRPAASVSTVRCPLCLTPDTRVVDSRMAEEGAADPPPAGLPILRPPVHDLRAPGRGAAHRRQAQRRPEPSTGPRSSPGRGWPPRAARSATSSSRCWPPTSRMSARLEGAEVPSA